LLHCHDHDDVSPARVVCVRARVRAPLQVRPLIGLERAQSCATAVTYPSPNQIQITSAPGASQPTHAYTYDHLYEESTTQQRVFDTSVAPLVNSFFEGYNATILAYGQTGSGKERKHITTQYLHAMCWTVGESREAEVRADRALLCSALHPSCPFLSLRCAPAGMLF